MHKDLLIIKFNNKLQVPAQDCKKKDVIPLYNYKLVIKIMYKDLLIIKLQRQQCLIEIYSGHIQVPALNCKNKDIIPS